MKISLNYGTDKPAELSLDVDLLLAHCDAKQHQPIQEITQAVKKAIESPLSYPPLSQAVIADDRIALAIEPSLPQCGQIVGQLINSLLEYGLSPENIVVIQTKEDRSQPLEFLSSDLQQQITRVIHQNDDREQLAYIAATKQGDQVLINRQLVDAEFVICVSTVRTKTMLGYHGIYQAIFPNLTDLKTKEKFQSPSSVETKTALRRRTAEAEEAAFMLGLQFIIQVVPSADGNIAQVIAGSPKHVEQVATEAFQKIWQHQIPSRADLVIAALSLPAEQQTWQHVGQLLSLASRVVGDGGRIALCTSLSKKPGPALQQLIATDDLDEALWEIRKQRSDDAIAAAQLANILKSKRVFLLSQLDEQIVEDLQMAAIAKPEQLSHLAANDQSTLVLCDTQHLEISVDGESANLEDHLADIDHSMDF